MVVFGNKYFNIEDKSVLNITFSMEQLVELNRKINWKWHIFFPCFGNLHLLILFSHFRKMYTLLHLECGRTTSKLKTEVPVSPLIIGKGITADHLARVPVLKCLVLRKLVLMHVLL